MGRQVQADQKPCEGFRTLAGMAEGLLRLVGMLRGSRPNGVLCRTEPCHVQGNRTQVGGNGI